MCGIAGLFCYASSASVDKDVLVRMRDTMIHRGPDGSGLWLSKDSRVGLAHRRLAIVDLSDAAAQPTQLRSSHCGRAVAARRKGPKTKSMALKRNASPMRP